MKMTRIACLVIVAMTSISTANAGGLLTNTNQNISFLRNPARDAAIGIDGVYSNPAGVAFLGDGYHIALGWQAAFQTRTVNMTSKLLDHSLGEDALTKEYKGHATAPFVPSVQFALNKGRWSFQFNFSVTGGGGKCEFDKGLGSFEAAVGQIGTMLKPLGVNGYDMNSYMQGKQFYFGFTLGAAYKITDNLSVYGGLRTLYGNASYKAKIENILVSTQNGGTMPFGSFIDATNTYLDGVIAQTKPYYEQYSAQYEAIKAGAAGNAQYQQLLKAMDGYVEATSAKQSLQQLEVYRNGVNLQCDQTGVGVAPIFGIDYKIGQFNFAAKYEFRTEMSMKNSSTVKEAMAIEAVNQFKDGESVREDSPALLTVGAQWSPIDGLRVNGGYHHFYDKQSKKYGDKQELLSGGTNEYLAGVEYDITDRLTISCGGQMTRYGLTDEYMSDLSFVTNSNSIGFGAKYKANKWVSIQAAYFKTMYQDYNTADGVYKFSRTNDVVGVGCEIDF